MIGKRPQADRILLAKISGEAEHRAKWRELTADEEAAEVAALRSPVTGLPRTRRGHCPALIVRSRARHLAGKYNFLLPDLGEGDIRKLRDPDATDDELPG